MTFTLTFRGSPLSNHETIVGAYLAMHEEYRKRWPRSIWGYQEAAAHGLEVIGKPELTPEESAELRIALAAPREAYTAGAEAAALARIQRGRADR